ncbi:WD40 repeat-like protein [Xylona heveae TC161]|uniref:WD40 repeat-like protein n=1 Tax=Xylona heveae (strain CBS 132557 / TC161) TaxID=1328760 RepID=A0A165AIF2_XYLHT|nr:WD40 repeat-like protein [Xylona heveae TC161]KZF20532.1 WD40 repeat-like protein [Xylona heveae TC161]
MAWQSPAVTAGGGVAGAGGDGSHSGVAQPQGTEYTLQGVMRFLQTEWHRHERDRNAWEIERAEMKARIAKMEGDNRSSKKMQDSLRKHLQLLEQALKKERERAAKLASAGQDSAAQKGVNAAGAARLDAGPPKHHNSFLEVEDDGLAHSQLRQDAQRDKSRGYLDKCVQEVTYLLTPSSHPPPQHLTQEDLLGSQPFTSQQPSQPTLEDVYLAHTKAQNQRAGLGMAPPSQVPNHRPPPVPSVTDSSNFSRSAGQGDSYYVRNLSDQQPLPQGPSLDAAGGHSQDQSSIPFPPEEHVKKINHSYDNYGRPIPERQQQQPQHDESTPVDTSANPDTDGWNFDEPTTTVTAPSPPPNDVQSKHRPDKDVFPSADPVQAKSPPRTGPGSHRRRSSSNTFAQRRPSDGSHELRDLSSIQGARPDSGSFKVRFAMRGHLDVVRSVVFTGGGSPSEPEICTTGDDGVIKRWIVPASYGSFGTHSGTAGSDLDIQSYFTHRGHEGAVTCLAACPASSNFASGGRAPGDGWIFSGGQDATVRVWERGRVDPKATLDGHTDAVWAVCVLPATCGSVFGTDCGNFGGPDRILLASGSADGSIKIWAVSAPPQLSSPMTSSRRGVGGSRRHSVSSGSNFPSSPQPSIATSTPFHYTLVHSIARADAASPTCISPLSMLGETFVVSYTDASVLVFDTRTGEEIIGMASLETYDGTPKTGVNAVVATTIGLDSGMSPDSGRGISEEENVVHGATGSSGGVEGVVISGHEDRFIRFFDANSGQCTYTMLAHPAAISSVSLSPDGRELVSAGHDASLRFWNLEKRSCTQEITSHRQMRGEGVCAVVWSQDGRWVVSGGGDGVVKVFGR